MYYKYYMVKKYYGIKHKHNNKVKWEIMIGDKVKVYYMKNIRVYKIENISRNNLLECIYINKDEFNQFKKEYL